MGIHVSICDEAGKDISEWDCGRMAGDRELVALVYSGEVFHRSAPGGYELCRPASFSHIRDAIQNWPNPDRLRTFCDLLENDTSLWVNFGF